MFDKTKLAAALLVLSAILLIGCCGGNSENAATGDAPGVPVVGGGTSEVSVVGGGTSEVSVVGGGTSEVPVVGGGSAEVPVVGGGSAEVPVVGGGTPEVPVVTGSTPTARVIQHPGAGLSLSDLQTLKANVDQGKQPWKSGYDQLANSGTARLSYAGRGGPFAKVSRAPDVNLHAWRSDMVAIWNLSRMWYFTGRPLRGEGAQVPARVGHHADLVLGPRVDARSGRLRLQVRGRRGHPARHLAGLDGGRHGHGEEVLQQRPDASSQSVWRKSCSAPRTKAHWPSSR